MLGKIVKDHKYLMKLNDYIPSDLTLMKHKVFADPFEIITLINNTLAFQLKDL